MKKFHEWEESKTGIRKHYRKILYPTLGVALAGTTTAAIALPIMIKKIAEERTKGILEKMIPLGGPENSLNSKDKISYMAIGDSITAGYNGYLDSDGTVINSAQDQDTSSTDYLSFADFIANDLKKENKLYDYRNFATTGDRIPNTREKIFRDQTALKAIQKANLISISLGANDLLAAVEVLKVSFNALRGSSQLDKIVLLNEQRQKLDDILQINSEIRGERGRTDTPSGYASKEDIKNLIVESYDKLIDMAKAGSLAGLIDIEQELLEHIFDLIQLDLATLVAEVHTASPEAKIVVLGYAFPFHLLPDSLINKPIPGRYIDGKNVTLKDVFGDFVKTIKTLCDRANYIKFFDINTFKEFSSDAGDVTYKLGTTSVTRSEWDRVMPNPFDIHPSTYGHQVIAGHIYEWMRDDMGLKHVDYKSVQKLTDSSEIQSLEKIYTYAGVDQNFDILDEKEEYDSKSTVDMLKAIDQVDFLHSLGELISTLVDKKQVAENYEFILNLIKDETMDTSTKVSTALQTLPVVFTTTQFGNVANFSSQDFIKAIATLYASADFSKVPAGTSITGIIPNLATSQFQIHGIKIVEAVLGALIYISADQSNIGAIDRTGDTLHDDITVVLKTLLNSMTSKSTPSMAELFVFGMAAPVLDGSYDTGKLVDEIFAEAKALGMNIDAVKPAAADVNTWLGDMLLGSTKTDQATHQNIDVPPLLVTALKKLGFK